MSKKDPAYPKNTTPPNTPDEETISTSTESETFEPWTLITDKKKKQIEVAAATAAAAAAATATATSIVDLAAEALALPHNRIELLTDDSKPNAQDVDNKKDHKENHPEHADAELSDEVSVISETDSGGRVTPPPSPTLHFTTDMPFKYALHNRFAEENLLPDIADYAATSGRLFNAGPIEIDLHERRQLVNATTDNINAASVTNLIKNNQSIASLVTKEEPAVARRSFFQTYMRFIYYGLITAIILGLVGHWKNPDWILGDAQKQILELERKLDSMELQNNLMRAEIDLLNKQVKHLSSNANENVNFNDKRQGPPYYQQQQQQHHPEKQRYENNKKPWQAAKESVETPTIITTTTTTDSATENDVINKLLLKTKELGMSEETLNYIREYLKKIKEKVNNKNGLENNNGNDGVNAKVPTANQGANAADQTAKQGVKDDKHYKRPDWSDKRASGENSKEPFKTNNGKYEQKKQFYKKDNYKKHSHEDDDDDNDDDDDDDDDDDSKERFYKQQKQNYESKKYNNNKGFDNTNSKERQKQRYMSGERINYNNNKHKDGEWHQKLMQQRENTRRNHEQQQQQRNEKNWFIERGDSREQKRHVGSGENKRFR